MTKPFQRFFSGFTILAFLTTSLIPLAPVYGMRQPMEEEDQSLRSKKPIQFKQPLVAGERKYWGDPIYGTPPEFLPGGKNALPSLQPKKSPLSIGDLQLKKADALLEEENYDEAFGIYKKLSEKRVKDTEEKLDHAFSVLIERADDLYLKKDLEKALAFYAKAAVYGSTEAKERISGIGLEAGDAHAKNGNQAEAVKCYEQAALYGNEEAKDRLKKSKYIEEEKLKAAEAKRKEEAEQQRRKEQAEAEEKQRQLELENIKKKMEALRKEKEAAEKREREAIEQLRKREETERKALEEQRSREAEAEKQRQEQRAFEEKQRQEEANRKAAEEQQRREEAEKLRLSPPLWLKQQDQAVYQQFLNGKLIYRPTEGSDAGKIELPIASLANPLDGTFDLSRCEYVGQYLSIATGYRKGKLAQNKDKVEIWLAPRFVIEQEINGSASHFQPIMGTWDGTLAPIGVFFTYGNWGNLAWYDYVTNTPATMFSSLDVYKLWNEKALDRPTPKRPQPPDRSTKHFFFFLS